MDTQTSHRYFLSALLVLSAVFFFYRLGSFALIGPDEPRYAQVAREMLERGDVVTPTIGGEPWFEKPALSYWLMMISMWLVGINEWGARLPSALVALLATGAVYYTGQRLVSRRFGFFSAGALTVNTIFPSFAHSASTDMPVTAMLTLGLCCFALFDAESDDRKTRWILAASAWFGLAMLAKGLIGVLLPAMILGGYLVLTRRVGQWREMELFWGAVIFLLVVSIWYVPVTLKHGWGFIDEFFISHHFQRFTSNKFHHPGPVYYYIPVIVGGMFPWTVFLVSAFARLRWSQRRSLDRRDRLRWFCVVWLVVPLLFFSFSTSKLPGYILPVFPAAAFLVADELDRLIESGRGLVQSSITAVLVVVVGLVGVILARRELPTSGVGDGLIVSASVLAAGALFYFSRTKHFRAGLVSLVSGWAVMFTLANLFYMPAVADKESLRPLAQAALQVMKPGEPIVGYYYFHHSLTFYTNARSFYDHKGNVIIAESPDALIGRIRETGSVLCVTQNRIFEDVVNDARLQVQLVDRQRDIVLARLTMRE